MSEQPLLQVSDLQKHFSMRSGWFDRNAKKLRAVDSVSLEIMPGETVGLVGESGCGKSTLGRLMLRLLNPNAGTIQFEGQELTQLSANRMRPIRKRMQMVFQDPYGSLNPRMTAESIIGEGLKVHRLATTRSEYEDKVTQLMERVGLRSDQRYRYPHEFSGGQRQRIGIARALAVEPTFIVCDEPVSALDVSVQAQIVNLLMDLRDDLGLSYVFIAHDLNVVRVISQRVAVMYLGKIVELSPVGELYEQAQHPYTQALLSSIPIPDPKRKRNQLSVLQGDVPSPVDPPKGCHFHTRCPKAQKGLCDTQAPELTEKSVNHWAACHLV